MISRKILIAAVTTLMPVGLAIAGSASPAGATAAANPTAIAGGAFFATAAASATDAWAVGGVYDATTGIPSNLAEHWNGKAWTRVPVPVGSEGYGDLTSVAVFSASDAWAAGGLPQEEDASSSQMFHWNGKAWSQTPLPVIESGGLAYPVYINAVKIASVDSVWAVGYWGPVPVPLILHWNGTAWKRVTVPALGTDGYDLLGLTLVSLDSAWAVGNDGGDLPLVLHWNGKAWSRVPAPFPSGGDDGDDLNLTIGVTAVAGSTAAGVWAAGNFDQESPYVIRWTGKKWVSAATPSQPSDPVAPNAAVVFSATNVWAVGTGYPAQAVHWNGKKWSLVKVGGDGTCGVCALTLTGLAGTSAGSIWAVGYTGIQKAGTGDPVSAIYHWNGKAWALAS